MRLLVRSAAKDLRRRLGDPVSLLAWIGLPLLIGGMISLVGNPEDTSVRMSVLVADRDSTALSSLLVGAMQSPTLGQRIAAEVVDLEEGSRRMDEGEATAFLILPAGLQDAVLRDDTATFELVTNPSEQLLPRIAAEGVELLVEATHYSQKLIAPSVADATAALDASGAGAGTQELAAVLARLVQISSAVVSPPISLEEVEREDAPARAGGIGDWLFPGILLMSLLFVAQGMTSDLWTERATGTLRRATSAPGGAVPLLLGKMLASTLIMALVALVAMILGVVAFDLPSTSMVGPYAWSLIVGSSLFAMLAALQVWVPSERASALLGPLVVFPLMMVGGSFFPFDAMPTALAAMGRWTPNGAAVLELENMFFGQVDAAGFIVSLAVVVGVTIGSLAVAVLRLRTFARE